MSNAIHSPKSYSPTAYQNSLINLKALQQAAIKLADLKRTPTSLSTRALLGLLICQTQRNKRLAQPIVRIHLRVKSKGENAPTYLRLGASNL